MPKSNTPPETRYSITPRCVVRSIHTDYPAMCLCLEYCIALADPRTPNKVLSRLIEQKNADNAALNFTSAMRAKSVDISPKPAIQDGWIMWNIMMEEQRMMDHRLGLTKDDIKKYAMRIGRGIYGSFPIR